MGNSLCLVDWPEVTVLLRLLVPPLKEVHEHVVGDGAFKPGKKV